MATAYSDEVAIGSYNRIRIKCDYSGTSAMLTIQFRRTSSYTGTWGDTQATLVFNGQSKDAAYNYSGTVGTSWVDLRAAISGYTIPSSGGTFNWTFNNPGGSSVLGCSGTLYIPAQGSAPSNGYINNLESYWSPNEQQIVLHTTSAGCNTGGLTLSELSLKFGITPYTDSGWPDASTHATYTITNGGEKWVSNNTARAGGTLSIIGNKQYYSGIYAANSAGSYRFKTVNGAPSIITVPPATDVWINNSNNSPTTKQIGVWFPANGGYYTQTFQYRLNGGSWTNGTTKTGGTSETKYVNLTGLTPHTAYIVETRVTTTAGTTVCPTVSFMTPASGDMEFYGSVSNLTEHINKFYCLPGGPNHFLAPSPSGGAYTRNGDTDFTVSATKASGTATDFYTIELALKPNTQYWFSCKKSITGTTFNYTGRVRLNLENSWTDQWDDNGIIGITTGATGRLKLGFYLWWNAGTATGTTTVRWYDVCVRPAEAQNAFLGYVPYNGVLSKNWYNYYYLANQASESITAGVYPWGFHINGGPQTSGSDKRIFLGTMTIPAGTYTMKVEYIGGSCNASFWVYQDQTWTRPFTNTFNVSSSNPVQTVTFTTTATATYHIATYATNNTISFSNYYFRVSVASGSTAMDFEPYTGFIPGAQKICKIYGSVNGVAKPFFIRHVHE